MKKVQTSLLCFSVFITLSSFFPFVSQAIEGEGDDTILSEQPNIDNFYNPTNNWDNQAEGGDRPSEYPESPQTPLISGPDLNQSSPVTPSIGAEPSNYLENEARSDEDYSTNYSSDYSYDNAESTIEDPAGVQSPTEDFAANDFSPEDDGSYDKNLDSQLPLGEDANNSADAVDPEMDYYSDNY